MLQLHEGDAKSNESFASHGGGALLNKLCAQRSLCEVSDVQVGLHIRAAPSIEQTSQVKSHEI